MLLLEMWRMIENRKIGILEICQPMSGKASAIDTNEPILNQPSNKK